MAAESLFYLVRHLHVVDGRKRIGPTGAGRIDRPRHTRSVQPVQPMQRTSARVGDRNNDDVIGTAERNDHVWEPGNQLPPNVVRADVVLKSRCTQRIASNLIKGSLYFLDKLFPQPGLLIVIPNGGGDRLAVCSGQDSSVQGEPRRVRCSAKACFKRSSASSKPSEVVSPRS